MNFFSDFNEVAKEAQEEAKRLGHEYIGTEHLLLALCRVPGCSGHVALTRISGNVEVVIAAVMEKIRPGPEMVTFGHRPQTPRAGKVVAMAIKFAQGDDSASCIYTDHLLLGLIHELDGVAGQVLDKLGVTSEKVREIAASCRPGNTESPSRKLYSDERCYLSPPPAQQQLSGVAIFDGATGYKKRCAVRIRSVDSVVETSPKACLVVLASGDHFLVPVSFEEVLIRFGWIAKPLNQPTGP